MYTTNEIERANKLTKQVLDEHETKRSHEPFRIDFAKLNKTIDDINKLKQVQ